MKTLYDIAKIPVKTLLHSKLLKKNKVVGKIIDFYVNEKIIPHSNFVDLAAVYIEVTNKCNAACLMCSRENLKQKQEIISNGKFERILEICLREGIKIIRLGGFGEPFIDKHLLQRMRRVLEMGFKLGGITTNGSLLTEEISEEILAFNGLPHITFSVDAFSKATYELIDRNLDYNRVIKNIHRFANMRNEKKLHLPKIGIQMAVMEENENEVEDFIKFWKPWIQPNGTITLLYTHNFGGNMKIGPRENQRSWRIPCNRLWSCSCAIDIKGNARLCCHDINSEAGLGNIFTENSIKNIWNGERIKAIRNDHRKYRFNNIPICTNCNDNFFVKPYYKIISASE